ncbi:hypothetical protein EPUS_00819 [Endocarpon pusillum Z07020]|uniref:Uncharacterized protein n=1 Tax=Endocarpon pusillum (strain Z07020 / HMAS-L-300199) TaxID=1263415 RepID=U1HYU9_ENDPU|nr:uncharacterized protein EPUS_00819 [Endocarpon pusillum Z07020]ERF74689.1 hypothetical protein EPUS_00819 [Endocarpon pusillum Z07020]
MDAYTMGYANTHTGVPGRIMRPWHPGFLARFPWLGLGALLGSTLGVILSVIILIISDGAPISGWRFQPTVYLSIASTATNIMLHFALTEGARVAWWRQAMKGKNKLGDLHRYWDFANNLWAATTSGRYFNLIAMACIFTAIAPINGPLLQRASTVKEASSASEPITVKLAVATSLPDGFSGYLSGRSYVVSAYTQNFTPVVQDYYNQRENRMNDTGCVGKCSATVKGVGFAVNCSSSEEPYKLSPTYAENGTYDATLDPALMNGSEVFTSYFSWTSGKPNNITLGIRYKDKADCDGRLMINECSLTLATVKYPVVIDGNRSTITLKPNTSILDDEVDGGYGNDTFVTRQGDTTTLGGIYLALDNKFNSSAHLRFGGAIGYEFRTKGATAVQYIDTDGSFNLGGCDIMFGDPTNDILASARELMFRTAIAAATTNSSIQAQSVPALQIATRAVYASHYHFLAIATLLTAIAVLLVLVTFHGYWHLGRRTTMSPLETAKAFNAPLLRDADSNAEVEVLVKELGPYDVRYGAVVCGPEGEVSATAAKEFSQTTTTLLASDVPHQMRLELNNQALTQVPRKGWRFSG